MQPGETVKPGGAHAPAATPAPHERPVPKAPVVATPHPDMNITWTASEYIAHQKNSGWYMLLGLGSVALALLIYFITGDMFSGAVIIIVGIIFGVSASRQPRTLTYGVGRRGIQIGEKFYPYADFKSFSLVEEDAIYSVLLLPMKRFMPGVSLYYPPDQTDEILDALSEYLPHELKQDDMFDRLTRRLRF